MSNAHRIVLNTLGKLHAHRHGLFGFLSAPQLARSRNPRGSSRRHPRLRLLLGRPVLFGEEPHFVEAFTHAPRDDAEHVRARLCARRSSGAPCFAHSRKRADVSARPSCAISA
jgi:hypothetical protein